MRACVCLSYANGPKLRGVSSPDRRSIQPPSSCNNDRRALVWSRRVHTPHPHLPTPHYSTYSYCSTNRPAHRCARSKPQWRWVLVHSTQPCRVRIGATLRHARWWAPHTCLHVSVAAHGSRVLCCRPAAAVGGGGVTVRRQGQDRCRHHL
jgi:hypothetical protein